MIPMPHTAHAGLLVRSGPYPTKVGRVRIFDECGRFLDLLAHAQIIQCRACIVKRTLQDVLSDTDALGVQALLSLQRTKLHQRITDKLLLLRRHQPSIRRDRFAKGRYSFARRI